MARKFQNIAFGYAMPSYFHNIESTLHIYVHVYYITLIHVFKEPGNTFSGMDTRMTLRKL